MQIQKIKATVLLLIGFNKNPISLRDQAKKLVGLGLNVIAPQAIIENTHEQFWEYIQTDITLADFIVTWEINDIENKLLHDTAQGKVIIDIQDINEITVCARRVSLKKM